jgi:branched-chain amino acid transport system substrate-binding protein
MSSKKKASNLLHKEECKMKKYFLAFFMSFLLLPYMMSMPGNTHGEEVIRIGTLFPLSGPMALLGTHDLNGVELATIMVNERGGIWGKKINLVKGDAPNPEAAASEAERLISMEKVKLIIGTFSSSLSYVASAVAERHKAIYWEIGAIADAITERGFKYLFRTAPLASGHGILASNFSKEALAPILRKAPNELKVAVMHEDSLYGTSVGTTANKRLKELGFNVVAVESYSQKATDLSPLVMKFKALKPDIIIATSYVNDAILSRRQMKELNLYVKAIVGTGAGYGIADFAKALGKDVNGIFSVDAPLFKDPAALDPNLDPPLKEVWKRYKEKYGYDIDLHAMLGFGGAMALYKYVLPKAGSLDPDAVRKVALQVEIPAGTTLLGHGVKFAGEGHPHQGNNLIAHACIEQWQDGQTYIVHPKKWAERNIINVPLPPWDKR